MERKSNHKFNNWTNENNYKSSDQRSQENINKQLIPNNYNNKAFLIIISLWLFLMLCVALATFMAAYLESSGVAEFTLFILAVTTFYWFCISIIPFASTNYKWTTTLCVNQRCGESFWLTALSYHKLHHDYSQKSMYMHGDGMFNATSIFYNNKNGTSRVSIERTGRGEVKGFDGNPSSMECHSSSFRSHNDNQSFHNFSNLLKTNFPDQDALYVTKKENYRNSMNGAIQIETNSKNFGLRSMNMTERSDNLGFVSKLKNLNHSWIRINMNDNINSNEPSDLAKNTLQFSQHDDPLSNEKNVILYNDHVELDKGPNQFWEKSSSSLRIVSFFFLLMNLMFYIYCWFAIYSYWKLLCCYLHGGYPSSDGNESDTYTESTRKSNSQNS